MKGSCLYRRSGKRLLDVVAALGLLLLLLPVFAGVALAVRVALGSPVIFKQSRPGRHGALFSLLKFRTMTNERDERGELLPSGMRMTSLGRVLRKTSLDELPELLNVVRGDMSLVGPRPWPVRYLAFYNEREMRRHDVRPGLTGLAQVSGRSHLDWDSRLELDVEYVEHLSVLLDLRILLKTATAVLRREGVVEEDRVRVIPLDEWRLGRSREGITREPFSGGSDLG